MLLLKRAVTKFKGRISDGISSTNETVRSNSFVARGTADNGNKPAAAAARKKSTTGATATTPAIAVSSSEEATTNNNNNGQPASAYNKEDRPKRSFDLRSRTVDGTKWSKQKKSDQAATSKSSGEAKTATSSSSSSTTAAPTAAAASAAGTGAPSSSSAASSSVASTMMHDFNLSMSEYRTEMKDNIAHLNDKINKLESVILELSEKLPQMVAAAKARKDRSGSMSSQHEGT